MLVVPTKPYAERRCDRCGGGRERGDTWIVAMSGRLKLHGDCAEALQADLESDLRELTELSLQPRGARW